MINIFFDLDGSVRSKHKSKDIVLVMSGQLRRTLDAQFKILFKCYKTH